MAEKLPPPAREEGVAADVDIAWVGPTQIGGNLAGIRERRVAQQPDEKLRSSP
jgi:hypothetical protein